MNCLFCKIASGEIPAGLVHQDEHVVAFRDIAPQAPTHILVIPRAHIENANALGTGHAALVAHLFSVARELAAAEGIAEAGYRLVMNCNADGGQTVFHLHLHLLGGRRLAWPPG